MTENELETYDSGNDHESCGYHIDHEAHESTNDHEACASDVDFKASDVSHSPIFHPQPVPENLKNFSMNSFLLLGFFCKLLQDVIATLSKIRYLILDQEEDSHIGLHCM